MSNWVLALKSDTDRDYSLDFLKFLAAIFIVFHHYQQLLDITFPTEISYWNGKFYWGYMVELFFVLSGFFMAKYVDKIKKRTINLKNFYLRRWLRVAPMVFITAVVYEIGVYLYIRFTGQLYFGTGVSLFGIITDTLCIQAGGVFPNPCVNNVTWYLSVLMICYVVFYLLTYLSSRLKINETYFFIAMILLGIAINTYALNLPFLNSMTNRGYYSFFGGLLLGLLVQKIGIKKNMIIAAGAVLAVFVMTCIFGYDYLVADMSLILALFIYPAIIILFQTKPIKKVFSRPVFGLLGKVSFDMYLWHNPLHLIMVILVFTGNITIDYINRLYMYLFLLAVIVVSFISYFLLEAPVDRWMKRRFLHIRNLT